MRFVATILMVMALVLHSSSAPAQAQAKPGEFKAFTVRAPDGVMIAAQEWGKPDGAEILFIHGFSQSHLSWSRQFDGELARSFRIITYDIRGHGSSDKPLDSSYYKGHQRWADELKAVIEAAKLKRPVLVGWSYGTRIIVEYLMEHGDGVIAGINFVGSFTKIAPEVLGPATPAVLKMASDDLAENIANTIAFLKYTTAKPLPAEELEKMVAYNMVVPSTVRRHLLGRPALYENTLKKIQVPVLITHGVEDRVALLPLAHYNASVIPNAELSLYEGVGHMPFWEDASRFNRELAAFVTKSTGR